MIFTPRVSLTLYMHLETDMMTRRVVMQIMYKVRYHYISSLPNYHQGAGRDSLFSRCVVQDPNYRAVIGSMFQCTGEAWWH